MKSIPLTKGFSAIVDDVDFERVSQFKWFLWDSKNRSTKYAQRTIMVNWKVTRILMHRFIMGDHHPEIDHRDGDGLNNTRDNLRPCAHLNNGKNCKLSKSNTSGFKGVSFHKKTNKWIANIRVAPRLKYLGLFDSPKEAALIYDVAAIKFYGEFAKTNHQLGLLP